MAELTVLIRTRDEWERILAHRAADIQWVAVSSDRQWFRLSDC